MPGTLSKVWRRLATLVPVSILFAVGVRLLGQTAQSTPNPPAQAASATPSIASVPPPVHLTAEQDHRRLLDLLGIKELRSGGEQDANWDEAKANVPLHLPDPLVKKTAYLSPRRNSGGKSAALKLLRTMIAKFWGVPRRFSPK